ncbi:MAG: peptidoglycan editing factor PgeF [Balneolaceae bacterium]|nr:peptidoglycan editing factor PgeF [Balneolaceae bacterium]MCH8547381.1 peptidoglycan editing factor PgeF [Balneolaceae bacterium]
MKIIRPKLFQDLRGAEALFTESNRDEVNSGGVVPGLNLGYNTESKPNVVDRNFRLLFDEIGWRSDQFAVAEQVHQDNIELVDQPGTLNETDGLITLTTGLALGIRVADCAAILAADPVNGVAGAFHAGWKGAAMGIAPKGIELMQRHGADPKKIVVYVSPCITQKNFEVGEEVASQFPDRFVDRISYNKPHVDLVSFIRHQILDTGIPDTSIEFSGNCTMENDQYYSYRREGSKAGRMVGFVRLI